MLTRSVFFIFVILFDTYLELRICIILIISVASNVLLLVKKGLMQGESSTIHFQTHVFFYYYYY